MSSKVEFKLTIRSNGLALESRSIEGSRGLFKPGAQLRVEPDVQETLSLFLSFLTSFAPFTRPLRNFSSPPSSEGTCSVIRIIINGSACSQRERAILLALPSSYWPFVCQSLIPSLICSSFAWPRSPGFFRQSLLPVAVYSLRTSLGSGNY